MLGYLGCTRRPQDTVRDVKPVGAALEDGRGAGMNHLPAFEVCAPTLKAAPGVFGYDFFGVDRQNHRFLLCLL